eukprot:scaffold54546_cov60-Phaeocystis_antarctica.AAC.1
MQGKGNGKGNGKGKPHTFAAPVAATGVRDSRVCVLGPREADECDAVYASWQSGHSITLPTNSAALQHIRTDRYHGLYGAPRAVHQARPRAMPVRPPRSPLS